MGSTIHPVGGPRRDLPIAAVEDGALLAGSPAKTLAEHLVPPDGPFAVFQREPEVPVGPVESPAGIRVGRYAQQRGRALKVLGKPASPEAAERIGFSLSGPRVDSREVIAAIEKIDVSALLDAGVEPVACLDFDNTVMAGDVLFEFLRFAAGRGLFPEAARPALIRELAMRRPDLATRDKTRGKTADELLEYVVERFEAGDLHGSDAYNVAMRAFRGMEPAEVRRIAEELFDTGLPGKGPYWQNAYDPGPEPKDSALELVKALQGKGFRVVIVTAGLVDLARIGARLFGVPPEDVVGAEFTTDASGRLTGAAEDIGMIGKDRLIRERVGSPPLFAFGDSWRTDGRMLPLALIQGFIVGDDPIFEDRSRRDGYRFKTMVFEPAP